MDVQNSIGNELQSLADEEFALLLAVGALIQSANSRAVELGDGFIQSDNQWRLQWPSQVEAVMGLRPNEIRTVDNEKKLIHVFFEPLPSENHSYWSMLFSGYAPTLAMEYSFNGGNPPMLTFADEAWLQWSPHVTDDERVIAISEAIAAQETVQSSFDWLGLTQKSVIENAQSALFKGLSEYVREN